MSQPIRIPNDLSQLCGRDYFVLTHYYGLGGHERLHPKEIGVRLRQAIAESMITRKGRDNTLARGPISTTSIRKRLYFALEVLTGVYPAFRLESFEPPVGPITPAQYAPHEWTLNYEERSRLYEMKRAQKLEEYIERSQAAIRGWKAELRKMKSSPTL